MGYFCLFPREMDTRGFWLEEMIRGKGCRGIFRNCFWAEYVFAVNNIICNRILWLQTKNVSSN